MRLGFKKLYKTTKWRWWMRLIRGVRYINYYPEERNLKYFEYEVVAYIPMWLTVYYSWEHRILLIYTWDGV